MSFGRWAIYTTSTGRIERIVTCDGEQLAAQLRDGEAWVAAPPDVSDASHTVEHFPPPAQPAIRAIKLAP